MAPIELNFNAYRGADFVLDLTFETTSGESIDLSSYSEILWPIYENQRLSRTVDLTNSVTGADNNQLSYVIDKIDLQPIVRHAIKFTKNEWTQYYCSGRIFMDDPFSTAHQVCTPKTVAIPTNDMQLQRHFE